MSSFSSKIQLVKGCPTDINGNGYKDDDFNHESLHYNFCPTHDNKHY